MSGRDLRWRAAGAALYAGSCGGGLMLAESGLVIPCILASLAGIVLMLKGKRVAIFWQAERRGHGETATAIHARRIASRSRNRR